MQLFVLTNHCTCRKHCDTCRSLDSGRPWREGLKKFFTLPQNEVDFTCPYGKGWNHKTEETNTVVGSAMPNKTTSQTSAKITQPKSSCQTCQRKRDKQIKANS